MYTWKTKFKPLDRVIWKYEGKKATIGTVHVYEYLKEENRWPIGYTILLDGFEPGDTKGLHEIAESGLILVE